MKLRTIIIPIVVILLLITTVVFLSFPKMPVTEKFWMSWHKKDIENMKSLATDFGMTKSLNEPEIQCWEVLAARCGIVYMFTTPNTLDQTKEKVNTFG